VQQASLNNFAGSNANGQPVFLETEDTLGFVEGAIVGDTTRYMSFGPFQGKRFRVSLVFGPHLAGDFDGNLAEARFDYRAYKQATRRSLLAFRVGTLYGFGDSQNTYGFGGLNTLRGYEFREFYGSRIAWSNLEFRFPLVDELRFPVLALRDLRGFFFLDVGAAWFGDDSIALGASIDGKAFYDPVYNLVRADYSQDPFNPTLIPFEAWDEEENRLQDARASYGIGFQFFFLGGLQFNWVWSKRLPYTQYVYAVDPFTGIVDLSQPPVPVEADYHGTRYDFYIQFDW
jgi:hypothetical protein